MTTYTALRDLIDAEIIAPLGQYAEEFDTDRMVEDLREQGRISWTPSGFSIDLDESEFAELIAQYDRGENARIAYFTTADGYLRGVSVSELTRDQASRRVDAIDLTDTTGATK